LWPLLTYGNNRFILYYDVFLIIFTGILVVETASLIDSLFKKQSR